MFRENWPVGAQRPRPAETFNHKKALKAVRMAFNFRPEVIVESLPLLVNGLEMTLLITGWRVWPWGWLSAWRRG